MLYVYPITFFILCLSHYQCEPVRKRFVPPSSGGSVAGAARRAPAAGAGVLARSSSPHLLKESDEHLRIYFLQNKRKPSSNRVTREAFKISEVIHKIYKITSGLPEVKYVGTERRHNSVILLRQFRGVTRTKFPKFHRFKRESNTFISPFAFSKHFKSSQNKSKTTNKTTGPNASLLRSNVDVKYSKYNTNLYAGLTTVAVNNTKNILDREVSSDNISTVLSHFNESRPNKIVFLNCQGYSNLTECRLQQKNYRRNRLNATEEPLRSSLNKNVDNINVSKVIDQTSEDVGNKEVKSSKSIIKDYSTTTVVDIVTPKSLVMDGKVVGFDSYHGKEHALPYATKENIVALNDSEGSWPIKHAAIVEGDLILGGLMMVHSREDSVTCGPVMPQGGVQALEAMLYTLDVINTNKLLPGVTLGAHVLDDCDKDTYGLEMAVDFIKGSISNIDDAEYACNRTVVRKVISGVVGAASSVTSIQVANLLRLFKIPQVSFFSTSPELSNKARFEYFTRTIPSDHHQVKAMVEIVKTLGWSYVSIVYEESNYGIKAYEELEALLARHDICIAVKEKLVKDSGVADEGAYDDIVVKLLTKPRARGAIIFGSDQEVAGVMRAVQRCNATGAFSWVGSDGWSARALVSDGNERAVEGTISVQPQANDVHGFRDYFLGLSVDNNKRNPWFIEFWEDHFQCRYPNSARTPYNTDYIRACTGKEQLTSNNTDFENQLQFVSDAVMAFAYAIRDMHADVCGGRPGLCDAMRPTSGPDLLRYLRRVHFTGLTGDEFRFDGNGDGPARYNILHFKQVTPGNYRWLKVGEYLDGELKLNLQDIQFKWNERRPPESVCSAECELGQAKQYVEGESCCWHCFNCTQYEIRSPYVETACMECARGTLPNVNRTYCRPIPEVFLRPNSGWAIGAMSLSSIGILLTSFVCGVFVRHHETPVVRASGRELSYVLLAGILMCYLVTFALVFRPTDYLCSLQRFGTGFCFTVVYAALLTKTNRISRIFNASKHSAKRPSLISPHSQLAICFGLVSVQVMIVVVWMVVAPAHAMYHYPTREDNMLVCDSYIDASYMIAFFYPILLILVCTVYAVLTRKIPEAFNESKHIGFTMYTTCVIWLAFVPLYFGTASHVPLRITSMSVTISLSASVTLVCLFSPKLYIILIRPERNVRQSMMPARYSVARKSHGPRSGVMAAAIVGAVTCDQDQINDNLRPQTKTFSSKYAQTEDTINSEKPVVPDPIDVVVNGTDEVNNVFAQDQINHSEIMKHENNGNDIVPFDVRNVKCKDCPDRANDDQNKIVLKENGIACIAITTTEVAL